MIGRRMHSVGIRQLNVHGPYSACGPIPQVASSPLNSYVQGYLAHMKTPITLGTP